MQEKQQQKEVSSRTRTLEGRLGNLHFADNRPQTIVQTCLIHQIRQTPDPLTAVRQYMKPDGESQKAPESKRLLKAQNSSSAGASSMNLTYHHVIDKDSLMNFWNAMRKIEKGMRAMEWLEYMISHLVERSKQHADTSTSYEIDGERADTDELVATASASITSQPIVNVGLGEIIERMYQWMPGNIFSGPIPEKRWHVGKGPGDDDQKDPNNGFELGAQYILPPDQYGRLFKLNEEISETVQVANRVNALEKQIPTYSITSNSGRKKKIAAMKELDRLLSQKKWVESWLHLSLIRLWLIADLNEVTSYNHLNWILTDPAGHTSGEPEYNASEAKYLIVK